MILKCGGPISAEPGASAPIATSSSPGPVLHVCCGKRRRRTCDGSTPFPKTFKKWIFFVFQIHSRATCRPRTSADVFKLHKKRKTTVPCARERKTRIDRPRIGHRSTLGRPSTTVLFVPSVRPRSNPDGTLPPGGPESSEFRPRLRRVYYRTFVDTDFRTTDGRFILLRCSDRRNGICLAFCRAKYGHYTGQTNEKSNVSHAISISTSYKTATHFMRLFYADCLT